MDEESERGSRHERYNRKTRRLRWIIGSIGILIVGGIFIGDMYTNPLPSKKENTGVQSEAKQTKPNKTETIDPRDLASFGHGTNIVQPNNDFSPEDVQNALDTGKPVIESAISSTSKLIENIVKEQKEMKESKQLDIKEFQQTITQDVRDRVDSQVEILNEASQVAHTMASGAYMAKYKDMPFTNTENVSEEKLEPLSQNLLDMAYSLETYTVARSFETWHEAANYLPNRQEKSLLAIPLNEAIFNSSSIVSNPIIAEPVTEEGNISDESEKHEQTDAERYPEAITSVFKISEAMNAIYVTADELQKRFTPYEKEDGFGHFEYISVNDLNDLYKFDSTISNEITSSIHFKAPSYTVDGFTQAMDSHRIIIKELDQLAVFLDSYSEEFQQDPGGTLKQAKGHLERIKIAAQTELPGFEQFLESAGPEAN
ncbi:hypothetical protein [Exiguobacterium sp. s145]|uniref:hypothetical protein n=3 Tax=Exiguobacterium TaxID=33986 RepID=UPI001BE8F6F9|nr:hypothetical protein [Exiguobacterium sp. s145]